jgi:hypothetical protein
MATYNTKDIYLHRAKNNNKFEEHVLVMQTSSVVVTDASGNLIMVPSSSFLQASNSASYALSSSYAVNGGGNSDLVSSSMVYISSSANTLTVVGQVKIGRNPTANGLYNVVGGFDSIASASYSHAEGVGCMTTGEGSHAEGSNTIAVGLQAHSEGVDAIASGSWSHAEGSGCHSIGMYSHAEGLNTRAVGNASHADGFGTIASGSSQVVVGRYNTHDNTSSLFIIGNGENPNTRSDLATFNSESITFNKPLICDVLVGTASYVTTSSYSEQSLSASYAPGTPSISASYAESASYAPQLPITSVASASWVSASVLITTAQTASYVLQAVSASWAPIPTSVISSSYALTSTNAASAQTSSYANRALSASFATNSLSASSLTAGSSEILDGPHVGTSVSATENITPQNYLQGETITYKIFAKYNYMGQTYYSEADLESSPITISVANASIDLEWLTAGGSPVSYVLFRDLNGDGYAYWQDTGNSNLTFHDDGTTGWLSTAAPNTSVTTAVAMTRINYDSGTFYGLHTTSDIIAGGNVQASMFIGTASYATQSLSASYATNVGTASYALQALSASWAPTAVFDSSVSSSWASSSLSASFATTASYARAALSASYAPSSPTVSASYASQALSASYASNVSNLSLSSSWASSSLTAESASFAPFPNETNSMLIHELTVDSQFLMSTTTMMWQAGPLWMVGAGSPQGVISASVGSLYTRTDGGSSTTLYVKETGAGGSIGWVAK